MAAVTLREHKRDIQNLMGKVPAELQGKAIQSAGNGLVRRMKDRIFTQGLDYKNKIIAEDYSKTPMYVPKAVFVKPGSFKARGKNSNDKKFGNGNTRKTMYLSEGYKELKKVQGLVWDRVNLTYSGKLKRGLVAVFRDGVLLIGFSNKDAANKREWNEKRFRKIIFRASREELLEYYASVIRHLKTAKRNLE